MEWQYTYLPKGQDLDQVGCTIGNWVTLSNDGIRMLLVVNCNLYTLDYLAWSNLWMVVNGDFQGFTDREMDTVGQRSANGRAGTKRKLRDSICV